MASRWRYGDPIEETMEELIQRAEAFLAAYPCSSSSGSSSGSTERPSGAPLDVSGNGREVPNSNSVSSNVPEESMDEVVQRAEAFLAALPCSSSSGSSSGSPRRRLLLRRIADAAPIVDSITLDDTIDEIPAPPPEVPEPAPQLFRPPEPPERPAAVVNEVEVEGGPPPAKRSEEESVPSSLNLSLSSDGGSQEPAVAVSCPICFESIFLVQAASTICGHMFCHGCISQEILLRKQCPLCKRKLAGDDVHPLYF